MSRQAQLVINVKKPATGLLLKWEREEKWLCSWAWPYKAFALIYAFNLKKLSSLNSTMNEKCSRERPQEVIIFSMMNKLHNWIQNMVQCFVLVIKLPAFFFLSNVVSSAITVEGRRERERERNIRECNCNFIVFLFPSAR